jgi:undecaprenyl-diphosphatase
MNISENSGPETARQPPGANRETWLFKGRLRSGILFTTAMLVIIFMMWVVFIYTKSNADQLIFDAIAPYLTLERTGFVLFITFLGHLYFLVAVSLTLIILFTLFKKKWFALKLAVVSIGGLMIKLFMKILLHRNRPINPVIEGGAAGFSFPSGHALSAVIFYGFLIWWVAISVRNKLLQGTLILFLILLILAIGFSRIYLRVHYTTDVLTGFCVGYVWLISGLWMIDKVELRYLSRYKKL